MNITFENNILYLPIVEAKKIKEGETVPLLFEISPCLIDNSTHLFDFNCSEPQYPMVFLEKEKTTFPEKYQLRAEACQQDKSNRTVSYQLAVFWHFLGDATHHSEPVKTPFGFFPGQSFIIENKYNVKPIPAYIKSIRLTRINENKWFWLVEVARI